VSLSPKTKGALFAALLLATVGVGFVARKRGGAGYPLAVVAPDAVASPLWRVPPPALEAAMSDDARRVRGATERLRTALELAQANAKLLDAARVDDLDPESRATVRDVWRAFVDPLIELDALKHRYAGWYGVDYTRHPSLHARAFALSHAALSAEVATGLRFLDYVAGRKLAQTLFDEAVPELGVPKGSFTEMRTALAGVRDQAFVPTGAEWYRVWIARELTAPDLKPFDELARREEAEAVAALGPSSALASATNKLELLKASAFRRWFPVQRDVAEWAGDTRVVPEARRLIRDAQITELEKKLAPGDIVVERRNWYLSNAGLPGFWPHAALHLGTSEEMARAFDDDEDVRRAFGGRFTEVVSARRAAAWKAFTEKDASGHPHRILEAVSEGVVAASVEHSLGADYVGALRPRMTKVAIARAIDRALSFFGRPYDFNFDFATDDAVVCSELVLKAYEGQGGAPGLRVPFVVTAGRRTVPPTELVRLFARERSSCDGGACEGAQLEFVGFLDGVERSHSAVWADAATFAASAERPKWDLAQP